MINDYRIQSGIDKNIIDEQKELSLYVQSIEDMNSLEYSRLIEIVEENPKILYEPDRITKSTIFPVVDLAFVYKAKKIIGHLVYIINREFNDFGYRTKVTLAEIYTSEEIPTNYFDEYILNRLKGNMSLNFYTNEKNKKK